MSITTLRKKQKRVPPKGKATIALTKFQRLTVEELAQITEPGHRKAVTEIGKEIVRKALLAKKEGQ